MAGQLSRQSMNTVCVTIAAIQRETYLKKYERDRKINRIEHNPHWNDPPIGLAFRGGVNRWPGQPPGHDAACVHPCLPDL
jgi:hypothetical protein